MNTRVIQTTIDRHIWACVQKTRLDVSVQQKGVLRKILQSKNPTEEDEDNCLNEIRSIAQRSKQQNGKVFEDNIKLILDDHGIEYKSQVDIDNEGYIVGFEKNNKVTKCHHRVDFVVGEALDMSIGKSIRDYSVLSCKTTCRERWKQDTWTLSHIPKRYYLLVASDDYPVPTKFEESCVRKIITCCPKRNDSRQFKYGYSELVKDLTKY